VTDAPAVFVDTNVLFDVLYDDPDWSGWSMRQLDGATVRGPLAINDVVYAELSVRFADIELLEQFIQDVRVEVEPTPRAALFLAGKAFQRYRSHGGPRTTILPDFFIGAHASVLGVPLLTRDTRRYQTYFPKLTVIAP
jgi:predicted nucleic acid-binding protein